jgi:hypothetical protein
MFIGMIQRQRETKDSASALTVIRPNASAVSIHDRAADR